MRAKTNCGQAVFLGKSCQWCDEVWPSVLYQGGREAATSYLVASVPFAIGWHEDALLGQILEVSCRGCRSP